MVYPRRAETSVATARSNCLHPGTIEKPGKKKNGQRSGFATGCGLGRDQSQEQLRRGKY